MTQDLGTGRPAPLTTRPPDEDDPVAPREGRTPSPLGAAPVVAEVVRSGFVESVHHGIVAATGPDGSLLLTVGPVDAPVLPRSSLKPLQTVAMLRAGAVLDGEELVALASASHSGEDFHQEGARRILASVGLTEEALQNTPDRPLSEEHRARWIAEGRAPAAVAQNCSGKHAAMLAACVAAGWDTAGYRDPDHPLQRLVVEVVEELTGEPVGGVTVDGCGAPALAVTPAGLARAFGRLASAAPGTHEARVADALRAHPRWLGGTGRDVTRLVEGVPGLIAKDGAESVYAVGLADGTGLAVKITDGGERARVVVMTAALRRLGALDLGPGVADVLAALDAEAVVRGHGRAVGAVRAVPLP
ncbi:asparaginase [Ornithinimicrobium cerasi]|uniref:Asparaginase n=1 Tax=Ornithinimicrobium cerasi TaxID=2248773 RepID=A0A285VSY4_9MICO|nr:asparaginase [Ornithinimicrobium cerasi]SOC56987.1 asparaginase [Ornithinimicrobium cerasi]